MKKVILPIAAIALLSFASCKKDHTCSCTSVTSDGTNSTTTTQDITIIDAKKGDAKKRCIDSKDVNTSTFGGVTITYTTTTTCELK